MQRALAIRQTLFGPEHPDVAFVLAVLAELEYKRHNYSDAESLYKRALNIWKKTPQLRSQDFAQTLENLGMLYFDRHRYDEAGALFRQAVTVEEQSLGKEHPVVAHSLSKVAIADLAGGHYDEAESPCKRALSILEKSSPPDYSALIEALRNYAWLLEKTKRKAEAELLETRAMVYSAKLQQNKGKEQTEFSAQWP
jgi:tetratricopeptide (TPR) repeat protein